MTPRPTLLIALLAAGALVACGGGESAPDDAAAPAVAQGSADAQTATVVGTPTLAYEPAVVAAQPGALTLTLRTVDGPPHNLVFDDDSLPSIGTVGAGEQLAVTYTLTDPGTYGFVCTFHPGMDGEVVVS